mmetsp:Transcript_58333/g.162571  ORF Transcript_58333/g.162571 Transcript_58333/m.162571 type:complete len:169 (+) Transcript_58333:97-603(+)|eukprot:CAMPEP_0117537876 /NCGR_PEP_ID=MMETSP0784-20121206/42193_1 /TAXON_ID=39447 /ORGANISM="" /LENGTH=168 /DNA_ID=CAMNT_0005334481 /DNA_START=97 /DNA_END=603 /DNA_ORIENTATION=-
MACLAVVALLAALALVLQGCGKGSTCATSELYEAILVNGETGFTKAALRKRGVFIHVNVTTENSPRKRKLLEQAFPDGYVPTDLPYGFITAACPGYFDLGYVPRKDVRRVAVECRGGSHSKPQWSHPRFLVAMPNCVTHGAASSRKLDLTGENPHHMRTIRPFVSVPL